MRDAQDLIAQKEVLEQIEHESRKNRGRQFGGQSSQRFCGNCKKPGHDARTCQKDENIIDIYSSDFILTNRGRCCVLLKNGLWNRRLDAVQTS